MCKTSIVEINGTEVIRKTCPVVYHDCPAVNVAYNYAFDNRKIHGVCIDTNRVAKTEQFKLGMDACATELETLKQQMQSMCRECKLCR